MAFEGEDKGEAKGFSGIGSLVSDAETNSLLNAKSEALAPDRHSTNSGLSSSKEAKPLPVQSQRQTSQQPQQSSPKLSGTQLAFGIAVAIGVLWLIVEANQRPSSPNIASTAPATAVAAPEVKPFTIPVPAPQRPVVPSRPELTRPPVGQNLSFSTAEIRYCLAEKIRIEAARSVLDNYSNSLVDRFNSMVDDYNSRCSSFRYRSGMLESARRDIEPYRGQFETEGMGRLKQQ